MRRLVSDLIGCDMIVEDTAHYLGLLLAPAEDFGRGRGFLAFVQKKLIMLFWPILGLLWCPVGPLLTFNSNLSNFEK